MRNIIKKLLIISLLLLVGCVSNSENYKQNLLNTQKTILDSTKLATEICQIESALWSKAIDNGDDFNLILQKGQKEMKEKGIIDKLNNNKNKIDTLMKSLNNPPNNYKDAYNKLLEIYGIYTQINSLALEPKGSLINYNSNISDLQNKLIQTSNQLNVLIPK